MSNFGGKIYPYFPLKRFLQNLHGEGVTGPHPSAKFNHFGFKDVGLQPPKLPKSVFFGNNLPQQIFTEFGVGEGLPGLHLHVKFFRHGFKNVGLEPPKSQKLVIFGIYLAKKGISP